MSFVGEPLIPGGYILLSRKLIESEIWRKPPLYLKVWVYLLARAQHGDYKGLKRGELRASIPEIMEDCFWYVGYRKVTPTKDQIFQILDWMRKPQNISCESNDESNKQATMITTTRATQGMLIKIDNYSLYQQSKNYESNDVTNDENDTKATMTHDNINKNDKNYKNDKDILSDDSIPKKEKKSNTKFNYEPEHMELAELLYDEILKNNPNHKKPDLESWANSFRLTMERDKRTFENLKIIIQWCQSDSFWYTNILSADKLRKQYDQLSIKMEQQTKPKPNQSTSRNMDGIAAFLENEGE